MKFYVRNKEARFCGNAPVWWAHKGKGYSSYLENAQQFDKKDAARLVEESPEKYEMYPCHLIDARCHLVFDWQDIRSVKEEMEKQNEH